MLVSLHHEPQVFHVDDGWLLLNNAGRVPHRTFLKRNATKAVTLRASIAASQMAG
jgi:hypothetical protein